MRNETSCGNCQHQPVCRHLEKYADAKTKVVSINKENESDIFEAIVVCKQYLYTYCSGQETCTLPSQGWKDPGSTGNYIKPVSTIISDNKNMCMLRGDNTTYPSGETIPTSTFDKYLKGGL